MVRLYTTVLSSDDDESYVPEPPRTSRRRRREQDDEPSPPLTRARRLVVPAPPILNPMRGVQYDIREARVAGLRRRLAREERDLVLFRERLERDQQIDDDHAFALAQQEEADREAEREQQQQQQSILIAETDTEEIEPVTVNRPWSGVGATCAICMEEIRGGLIKTPALCGHSLHYDCFNQFEEARAMSGEDFEHLDCPTCRRPIL